MVCAHAPPPARLRRVRAPRRHAVVPAPWPPLRCGEALQDRLLQPLSGAGAPGGKTALVGLQMAVDRINENGGINGRPVEIVVADDKSKPDVGRRKTEKMLEEDKIDAHVGGFLSNICLACMPVFEEQKVLNMISVCLDTTLTTTKCNRYSFRAHDYAPSQAVAFAPYSSTRWARSGTSSTPTIPGASRPATPTLRRSRRPAARWSAPPAFRSAPPT